MNLKNISKGRIYITATFNNTLITVTDEKGDAFATSSSGAVGFKGSRKATPYAATSAIERALKKAKLMGLTTAQCFIKGPGPGRESALRALRASGLRINMIADLTPMPHNGSRPKKRRRV